MRKWFAALVAVLVLPALAALPADAGRGPSRGSFVARGLPFPALQADVYYPQKGSCLDGLEGVHKVSEPFQAPSSGTLSIFLEALSGDWDLYVLETGGARLGASEAAQVLGGAGDEERVKVSVAPGQYVDMVACNWLGEPEVTVHFDFSASTTRATKPPRPGSASRRGPEPTTHTIDAVGGPVTPLWEWDPPDVEAVVGDRAVWLNESGVGHHVTPYGGPWKDLGARHLPNDGRTGFVFRKSGEYLYRCDVAFAGVEHSVLVGDQCIGMCGRIVVDKRS